MSSGGRPRCAPAEPGSLERAGVADPVDPEAAHVTGTVAERIEIPVPVDGDDLHRLDVSRGQLVA